MLKEAIEKIVSLAGPEIITCSDGTKFAISKDNAIEQIRPELDYPTPIVLNSLDALIQMVKTEAVLDDSRIYLSVRDHLTVSCFGHPIPELRENRIVYYEAQAKDVPGWDNQVKMPFDQAAVALQTRFQDSADRPYTLTLLSQITTGAKVTYNDTGVATTVVTSKGVSLQQNSTIRPLVKLRPYRTFQEVEQPEGLFLIRIDERGITFTEADGGMWKLQARQTIKAYLVEALKDEIEKDIVTVMM
jgi:hypothetical protein